MNDDICTQFKSTLKWSNCIRTHFPTLIFYFAQTYDQTIVIYYRGEDGGIKMAYTKLSVDDLNSTRDIPTTFATYFTLIPKGNDQFSLPCLTNQALWRLSVDGKLVQDDRVLVSTMGVVAEKTQELECVYCIFVNKTKRKIEWSKECCTEEARTYISDMKGGAWSAFKHVIGS